MKLQLFTLIDNDENNRKEMLTKGVDITKNDELRPIFSDLVEQLYGRDIDFNWKLISELAAGYVQWSITELGTGYGIGIMVFEYVELNKVF